MKKKFMICTMLICTLFLTGCLKKTKISISSFEETLKKEGYVVEIASRDYLTNDTKSMASATSKNGFSVNYIEYYEETSAKNFYQETYDRYENSCSVKTETSGTNYNTFKCESGKEFIAITRVENTVVFALSSKDKKDDIKKIIKKLKY